MAVTIRWQEEHVDWKPLERIIGAEGAADWMWMHCTDAPDTGETVHFYKHINSRRYLRLDAQGHVYKERRDGTPVVLRDCQGATLLLLLIQACAAFPPGMPRTITLPDVPGEGCTDEDLELLDALALLVSEEFRDLLEVCRPSDSAAASYGREN
jgi:hypothetical protein